MTTVKHTYTINNFRQLIDLNGESINFDIKFKVVSHNREPFDVVVVDQTTLDNSTELQYNHVAKGIIEGSVVHDKNIYQNYFLCLKASNPCKCDVEITKKDLPKTPMNVPVKPSQPKMVKNNFNWKKWLLVICVASLIGFAAWYYFTRIKPMNNRVDEPVLQQTSRQLQSSPLSPLSPTQNSSSSLSPSMSSSPNKSVPLSLAARLKSLYPND